MGRPYKKELEAMGDTYDFIDLLDVSTLVPFFKNNCNVPLLIIGSGGSFAVAKLFELCYQNYGGFAKAITPYELKNETKTLGGSKVLIVTAGGNNPDTVGTYNYVRLYEPFELCIICMSKNSKIAKEINKNNDSILYEVRIPFGKDGYLAVNSSVAMFTIGKKIMDELENNKKSVISFSPCVEILPPMEQMEKINNFIVLYGGWGTPAAYDLESKCSEAGPMSIQFINYRNFAHGRHNWIDKKKDSTMLVALVTPDDKIVCKKTLEKLPSFLPIVCFETKHKKSMAALDLLVKVFYFVDYLGELRNIDPGKPHVPDYGSKLYNIKYNLLTNDEYIKKITKSTKDSAIYRKLKMIPNKFVWFDYYSNMYDSFVDKIYKEVYQALLLDYDGTICDSDGKVSSQIINKLNMLLENNIIIAFATGRGDSIIKQLRKKIPQQYWENVVVGYYNGSYISNLTKEPKFQGKDSSKLKKFYDMVNRMLPFGGELIDKGYQLSIREADANKLLFYFEVLNELKYTYGFGDIQVFISGHAIDIVENDSGKQKVVEYIKSMCNASILCIGDEGRLYENDFELLTKNIGLSSKNQNKLGESGWNLAPLGVSNVRATEYYVNKIKILENGFVLEEFK